MQGRSIVLALVAAVLMSCASTDSLEQTESGAADQQAVALAASLFFELYADRQNIDALMAFYAEDAVLEDMVYGERVLGKDNIQAFLDWSNPHYQHKQPQVLIVEQQIVEKKQVITRGYFTPFVFHGQALGPWRFVIWQSFDEQGRIVYQQDWINYTPREQFLDGKDLNKLNRPAGIIL